MMLRKCLISFLCFMSISLNCLAKEDGQISLHHLSEGNLIYLIKIDDDYPLPEKNEELLSLAKVLKSEGLPILRKEKVVSKNVSFDHLEEGIYLLYDDFDELTPAIFALPEVSSNEVNYELEIVPKAKLPQTGVVSKSQSYLFLSISSLILALSIYGIYKKNF